MWGSEEALECPRLSPAPFAPHGAAATGDPSKLLASPLLASHLSSSRSAPSPLQPHLPTDTLTTVPQLSPPASSQPPQVAPPAHPVGGRKRWQQVPGDSHIQTHAHSQPQAEPPSLSPQALHPSCPTLGSVIVRPWRGFLHSHFPLHATHRIHAGHLLCAATGPG